MAARRCNLCGGAAFLPVKNRPEAKCASCGSLERTRLLWLYLKRHDIHAHSRILHLAPERGLYKALSKIVSPDNYRTADIDPARYRRYAPRTTRLDLCALDNEPSYAYDFIIHSHVMEHIPCCFAYTLFHLHRMLAENGLHICVIPFSSGAWEESFQALSADERERRFFQHDHMRRFGRDDRHSHLGKVIRLPKNFDATEIFTADELRTANIPKNYWSDFTMSTVLELKRQDYLLCELP
jgi:phosphoglycolate phosphatase